MWSATVFEPALPRRSRNASGSPVPWAPWSRKAHSGWNPNPRLNVGAADSFSEWAPTRVASTSITTGRAASAAWSGACSSASDHAGARAVARAVLIAASEAGTSAASASISRDTVGSEATSPNTSGAPRSWARSARQSPPIARLTARSSRILPGSWRANGFRHGVNACDSAVVSPTVCAVLSNSVLPACGTTLAPAPSAVENRVGPSSLLHQKGAPVPALIKA